MNTMRTAAPGASPIVVGGRRLQAQTPQRDGVSVRRTILASAALCVLPAALLFGTNGGSASGYWLYGAYAACVLCLAMMDRRDEIAALTLATLPWLHVLRGAVSYTLFILVVMAGAATARGSMSIHKTSDNDNRQFHLLLTCLAVVYMALSQILSGAVLGPLRILEPVGVAWLVLRLVHRPVCLSAGLLGYWLGAIAIAVTLLPYVDRTTAGRLGSGVFDGIGATNPVQLGVPIAVGCVVCLADGGVWLGVGRTRWTWSLVLIATFLLLLTGSRLGWLVLAVGVLVQVLSGPRRWLPVVAVVGLGWLALAGIARSSLAPVLAGSLARTFSADGSAAHRTSGRSDQWNVISSAAQRSVFRLWLGSGPGTGPAVYGEMSLRTEGVRYSIGHSAKLHGGFLQLLCETGLLGVAVAVLLLARIFMIVRKAWRAGCHMPAAAFASYLAVISSVAGVDGNSGLLIGLSLVDVAHFIQSGGSRSSEGTRSQGQCTQPADGGAGH